MARLNMARAAWASIESWGASRRRSEDVKRGTSVMVMSVMEAVTMEIRTTSGGGS